MRDQAMYVLARLHEALPSEEWDEQVQEAALAACEADGGHEHQKKLMLVELRRLNFKQRPDFVEDHIYLKDRLRYYNLMIEQASGDVEKQKRSGARSVQRRWEFHLRHYMDALNYTRWRLYDISDRFKTYVEVPYSPNYRKPNVIALKYITHCITESTPFQNYEAWKAQD